MVKIDTLSQTKTAKKTVPFGAAQSYIAYIRKYSPERKTRCKLWVSLLTQATLIIAKKFEGIRINFLLKRDVSTAVAVVAPWTWGSYAWRETNTSSYHTRPFRSRCLKSLITLDCEQALHLGDIVECTRASPPGSLCSPKYRRTCSQATLKLARAG